MRRENVAVWITVDPTHLARRLDIDVGPLAAVLTAVSCRTGGFLLWVVGFFDEVVANAVVGVL